ncbi:efflux RND transporter periplasmic adaptor subunit [Tenacibaculum finnmarkense]|uniref:Efflux RND transporter periplasmic adaptor subunit n=1 Tax=Tenacibaculum finnmarkense genomovar finnmarkense TaxID=1458503 RepID=A0AAP1WGC2_9FLAO|nr:efflux RND transporter periplasmic adaptor subunit [Tenacibaculum finnmarkense]MBE7652814.1 efflux RND transporter periplasmic adaptor subunit [Tenacibaculum finnmarkense genomovar finnmarkense]MBE7695140.1 efflux RND transporter periplasmic adaptor subunit [Tenacibaculum finnmarkense genomovar finnmarkense]MCD8411922.1 efflux RND transporter periplasmic adaptor subunit [Tenacibaculum finnmarkense genomovar ulcerans]MCD8427164.1 efflux RND transporter periplasmic adaptor subunit [Tenacibacul
MSKRAKIILGIVAILFAIALIWFAKKNKKNSVTYETETAFRTTIVKKTVATGKVIPLEEVEIKPQIAGIVSEILVEEGAIVKAGDLIAKVRVVPNVASLNRANGSVKNAKLSFNNAKLQFDRNKNLFDKGVISRQDFENAELNYNNARLLLANAKSDMDIIKKGTTSGLGSAANTSIRATTSGMVVEIPVKKGYQVTQTNDFNAGTTIARIADMTKMIFEGKVDESEVGKLIKGTAIEIAIGAIENKKFPAVLNFIAPKGTDEGGAVQFKIKADVTLDDAFFIRAGYSANADIVLEKKDSVLSIKEALLRFDKKTEEPYVEVETSTDKFEKITVKLGTSDGVNVEVLEGVTKDDKIKIWNKASKDTNDTKKEH